MGIFKDPKILKKNWETFLILKVSLTGIGKVVILFNLLNIIQMHKKYTKLLYSQIYYLTS